MAIDWRRGMQRTYELVRVDAETWTERELVQDLSEASIDWESDGLRYSASMTTYSALADSYYRLYMLARQGGESQRIALATVRVQTPKRHLTGTAATYDATGYSPLVELDADYPPPGWTATGNVVQQAAAIVAAHCHAPCDAVGSSASMEPWTAGDNDTWLDCLEAVLAKASMHVEVDGHGRIHFVADDDPAMLAPVWIYDDAAYGLPSILMPDVDEQSDYFDLANKVEVIYSTADGVLYASAIDEDPKSPTGTVMRGYIKTERETSPEIDAPVTQAKVDALARQMLEANKHVTHEATFEAAFVPVIAPGRCVRLDYTRHGYRADATVESMSMDCDAAAIMKIDIEYEEVIGG